MLEEALGVSCVEALDSPIISESAAVMVDVGGTGSGRGRNGLGSWTGRVVLSGIAISGPEKRGSTNCHGALLRTRLETSLCYEGEKVLGRSGGPLYTGVHGPSTALPRVAGTVP